MVFEINSKQKPFHFWYINQAPSAAAKTAINIIKNGHIDPDSCRYCLDEGQNCYRKKIDRRCAFCAAKGRTHETCMLGREVKKIAEKKTIVNAVPVERRSAAEKSYPSERFKTVEKIKIPEKSREPEKSKRFEKSRLVEKKTLLKRFAHDVASFRLAQAPIRVFSVEFCW